MKNLRIINQEELKDWAKEIFQKNSFNMVDVSSKKETFRRALASGKIYVGNEVFDLIISLPISQIETVSGISISTNQSKVQFFKSRIGKYTIRSCKKKILFIIAIFVLAGIIVLGYIIHAKKSKFPILATNNQTAYNFWLN